MKFVAQLFFAALALGLAAFASSVAFTGAEPALPPANEAIEGVVVAGETVPSPVGAPFLYGEISLQDSDNNEQSMGTVHWSGAFGNPRVRVQTAEGEREVTLAAPKRWRVLPDSEEARQVASLEGLPHLADIDVGDRLSPPFRIAVRALREGDRVIVAKASNVRVPVYVGERAALESARAQREAGRWPIVIILAILALSSLILAVKIRKGSFLDGSEGDPGEG